MLSFQYHSSPGTYLTALVLLKDADGMANSVDPDQTGPAFALYALTYLSQNLEFLLYHIYLAVRIILCSRVIPDI